MIKLRSEIMNKLTDYHKKYSLRKGISKEEIRSSLISRAKPKVGEMIIDKFIEDGYLDQDREFIKIKGFEISYDENQGEIRNKILKAMYDKGFNPPKKEEILETIGGKEFYFDEVYNSIITEGILLRLTDDIVILKELYEDATTKIKEYLDINKEITVGEFRDLLDTNRKAALGLLENFDKEKITKRDGDKRRLY